MDKKYNVKTKIDGRNFTFGNVAPGNYGPRLGLRVTPELRNLVAGATDGSWLNFNLYEDDGKFSKPQTHAGDDSQQDAPW